MFDENISRRYSLRKLSIGLASVMIGLALFINTPKNIKADQESKAPAIANTEVKTDIADKQSTNIADNQSENTAVQNKQQNTVNNDAQNKLNAANQSSVSLMIR